MLEKENFFGITKKHTRFFMIFVLYSISAEYFYYTKVTKKKHLNIKKTCLFNDFIN